MTTTKIKNMNKFRRGRPVSLPKKQSGIALIMVLTALFALTLLGLASTDSSNLQALMVRNNQFRLEAFNMSFSEIGDQITFFQTEEGKDPLFGVIETDTAVTVSNVSTDDGSTGGGSTGTPSDGSTGTPDADAPKEIGIQTASSLFVKEVAVIPDGGCAIIETSLGGFEKCTLILLNSDVTYRDTNIGSDQSQQFSFKSF